MYVTFTYIPCYNTRGMYYFLSLAADGRWYHRNHDIGYRSQNKVKYTIIGEIDGKTVISKGKMHPGNNLAHMLISLKVQVVTLLHGSHFPGTLALSRNKVISVSK